LLLYTLTNVLFDRGNYLSKCIDQILHGNSFLSLYTALGFCSVEHIPFDKTKQWMWLKLHVSWYLTFPSNTKIISQWWT